MQLFGLFKAEQFGQPLPDITLNNANRLLCFLVLQEGCPAQATWIAEALWPRTQSIESLRKSIQQLRKALGDEAHRIHTQNGVISLDLNGVDLDLATFDAQVAKGDDCSLGKAIDLYRSSLLKDWSDPWVLPYRENYEALYRNAVEKLLQTAFAKNQSAASIVLLRRATSVSPETEAWWIKLIELQAITGEYVEAIATARRYYTHLNHLRLELGIAIPASPIVTEMVRKIQTNQRPIAADPPPNVSRHEAIGGATPTGSAYYVERPEDAEVHSAVSCHASIILIKGSNQTGKSSLVVRALRHARDEGIAIVRTAWQSLDNTALTDISAFYRAQITAICKQLQLDFDTDLPQSNAISPVVNFERFVRDHLLHTVKSPILWAIDDADRMFVSPFRDDVFGQFRAWHNERAYDSDDPLNRFTLLLSYSAEAHLSIRNLNRSPFNVGTRVSLGDFTFTQVERLNERYDNALTDSDLKHLSDLVGGHPYLLRKAMYEVRNRNQSITDILALSETADSIFLDHLNRMLEAINQDPDIHNGLRAILDGGVCGDTVGDRLCAAGVLVTTTAARLCPRNLLYDRFLRRRLI